MNHLKAFLFSTRCGQDTYHRLPRSPRSREKEPPPPLSDLGLALDTDIALPSRSFPFNSFIASSPALSDISTKANPLNLPISLSIITFAEVTSPNLSKRDFNTSSVTWKLRLDTYMFIKTN